jgi:hypothetical protein
METLTADTTITAILVEKVHKLWKMDRRVIFKRAFAYAEKNVSERQFSEIYVSFHNHGIVPQEVEDYCFQILTKKIFP